MGGVGGRGSWRGVLVFMPARFSSGTTESWVGICLILDLILDSNKPSCCVRCSADVAAVLMLTLV